MTAIGRFHNDLSTGNLVRPRTPEERRKAAVMVCAIALRLEDDPAEAAAKVLDMLGLKP